MKISNETSDGRSLANLYWADYGKTVRLLNFELLILLILAFAAGLGFIASIIDYLNVSEFASNTIGPAVKALVALDFGLFVVLLVRAGSILVREIF